MVISTLQTLSGMIRDYRNKQNMTQGQIARLVGIKQSTVSAIENSPDSCKISTLFKVLSALKLEIHLVPRKTDTDSDGVEW
jgi:HTH-type transcriptional regulator/antitoxin HipB